MSTQAATQALRPLSEVEPIKLGDGTRVFRGVKASGNDLLALGDVSQTRWEGCDLSGTTWPRDMHDVTIVDSDLSRSVMDLDSGRDIRITGTQKIRLNVVERPPVALNLDDVAARVDGMRISGNVVGLGITQVATAPENPLVMAGRIDGTVVRGSFLPNWNLSGLVSEDLGISRNCAPGLVVDNANITRLTAAHLLAPDSSWAGAQTRVANLQSADLDGARVPDWDATKSFFELARISNWRDVTAGTDLAGSHLTDTIRTGTVLHAENVRNADWGPNGEGRGTAQPRKAARITAVVQRASDTVQ